LANLFWIGNILEIKNFDIRGVEYLSMAALDVVADG
jgi:hypothetical protein